MLGTGYLQIYRGSEREIKCVLKTPLYLLDRWVESTEKISSTRTLYLSEFFSDELGYFIEQ